MDRAEAIRTLQTEIACVSRNDCARIECAKCDLVLEQSDILAAYDMAIAALREQESLAEKQATSEWVSVEERLPEVGKTVLTLDKYGHIHDRYMYKCADGVALFTAEYLVTSKDITHWMNLPEPPKEGAEG